MALNSYIDKEGFMNFTNAKNIDFYSTKTEIQDEFSRLKNVFNECPSDCDIILELITKRLIHINSYLYYSNLK